MTLEVYTTETLNIDMKIPLNWLKEIVSLPDDIKKLSHDLTMVGHMLDKVEVKNGETILDLELRGNRADCYSILGIAREVSDLYGTTVKSLPVIQLAQVKKLSNVSLSVKSQLVKRVGMVEVSNVKITKSPKWLISKITSYGMESVNNIVDLTNLVMIEAGEPMHAFDLDKVKGNLEIRLAKDGERMTTFMGLDIKLTKEDLVWAKADKVLSVAGAVGEKHNSISDSTKNILVEAANYDRANIRRTVYRHKLLTDAGIRHEKELDPNMVDLALSRFLYFVRKYGWGDFKNEFYDYYPNKVKPWKIDLSYDYLKTLSGIDFAATDVKQILSKLQFEILGNDKRGITVLVPTYRTDVTLPEDLIEEIVRIYGYDKIPTKTLSLEIPKNVTPSYIIQEENLRNAAISLGFDESTSLSFVKEEYLDKNIPVESGNYKIVSVQNPPSPDTRYLRVTLFPNLLESAQKIINERGKVVQLFEIGKIYLKENAKYIEKRKIGLIYWKQETRSFQDFKSLILGLFNKVNIDSPNYLPEILNLPLTDSYLLKLGKKNIGFGGKYNDTYYCEIDLDTLLVGNKKYLSHLWPKYPPQIEDLTLLIPEKTYIGEVVETIKNVSTLITSVDLKDIFKDAYTFNIEYQNPEKTLDNKEVGEIREKALKILKSKFEITLKKD